MSENKWATQVGEKSLTSSTKIADCCNEQSRQAVQQPCVRVTVKPVTNIARPATTTATWVKVEVIFVPSTGRPIVIQIAGTQKGSLPQTHDA
jgi:hypothetical protein